VAAVTKRRSFQLIPGPRPARNRRHVGESLAQVVLRDPAWYFFAEKYFRYWGLHEHREISAKARSIIVEPGKAVLYKGRPFGGLSGLMLVDDDVVGGALDEVRPYLDLSVVANARGYRGRRKMGKQLTAFFKRHVLGNAKARITEKCAEEFFSDDSNFAAYRKQSIGSMPLRKPFGAWTVPGEE